MWTRAVCAAFAFFLTSALLAVSLYFGSLEGMVKSENGSALKGVRVIATPGPGSIQCNEASKGSQIASSGANGRYKFVALKPGNYAVCYAAPEYASVRMYTQVKEGVTNVLTVTMKEQQTGQPSDKAEWCKKLPRPEYKRLEKVEVPDAWFEVYRIRPGVFAIYEPHQFQEVISYLIAGKTSAVLFDTGMGISRISPVVQHLTALPVTVLNSHTHPDHVGGNFEFASILGVDSKYTQKNTGGYSSAEVQGWASGSNVCGPLPKDFEGTKYHIRPFALSRFVHGGEILDLGERELEVIFTPGHTPDSLCLLDRSNRLLFTGDTFYPGPIYLFSPETDFDAYAKSVTRLAALEQQLDLLLPAHNLPVASPAMLSALLDALRKIQKGGAHFSIREGLREYSFEGFSILLKSHQDTKTQSGHEDR